MNCTTFQELAFDYLSDDLSADQTESVRAHTIACSSCAATLRSIEENERILTRARVPAAPDRIWDGIQKAILPMSLRAPARPRRFGWVAAAAAILVLVGALLVSLPQSTAGPELEVVDVRGRASETLGGLIPGYEEPGSGTRVAGSILVPGDGGR